MKLIMKRALVMAGILGVDPDKTPTFQLRGEHFRLARGPRSIATVPNDEAYVELDLERVLVVEPGTVIVLRGNQVQSDVPHFRRGRMVAG